ncbi:MAG: DUF2125 domain-containing protein [Rhodospirillaceae bacterium]
MLKKVLGFCVVLALIYGAAWLGAAFWLRARVDAFVADLNRQGYVIERSEPVFAGFPARVGLKVAELGVTAPPAQGGWRWQGTPVGITLSLGAPADPVIDLTGVQRITGLLSAPEEGLVLRVGHGLLTLTFAQDQALETLALMLADTTVTGTASPGAPVSVRESSLHVSRATGHLTWRMDDVGLPEAIPALGQTIRRAEIAADLVGPFPDGPLRNALETWRDAGGTVEVRSFALDWPPARAAGTGTLALDPALQPMGAATITFHGFFDLVAALQAKGYVRESEAGMAKIVLGMLARPSPAGAPELSLPVTVQDRKLRAGPVALMEMPEVIWDREAKVP